MKTLRMYTILLLGGWVAVNIMGMIAAYPVFGYSPVTFIAEFADICLWSILPFSLVGLIALGVMERKKIAARGEIMLTIILIPSSPYFPLVNSLDRKFHMS